jgi:hypothetical protein
MTSSRSRTEHARRRLEPSRRIRSESNADGQERISIAPVSRKRRRSPSSGLRGVRKPKRELGMAPCGEDPIALRREFCLRAEPASGRRALEWARIEPTIAHVGGSLHALDGLEREGDRDRGQVSGSPSVAFTASMIACRRRVRPARALAAPCFALVPPPRLRYLAASSALVMHRAGGILVPAGPSPLHTLTPARRRTFAGSFRR